MHAVPSRCFFFSPIDLGLSNRREASFVSTDPATPGITTPENGSQFGIPLQECWCGGGVFVLSHPCLQEEAFSYWGSECCLDTHPAPFPEKPDQGPGKSPVHGRTLGRRSALAAGFIGAS